MCFCIITTIILLENDPKNNHSTVYFGNFWDRVCYRPGSALTRFVSPAGRGAATDRGGAEKDPRGAHEAGAGPAAAAERGAENHPGEGKVQTQAVLLPEGGRMTLRCPAFVLHRPLHPHPHGSAPLRVVRCGFARFILEVLKERSGRMLLHRRP